jgi:phosphatase NudJ
MPDGFHVVCATIIRNDDSYLLVREAEGRDAGTWNLPAGSLEQCETPLNCAEREVAEETGLDVTVSDLVGVYFPSSAEQGRIFVFVFATVMEDGDIEMGDEIDAVDWVGRKDLEAYELRADYIGHAIRDFEEGRRYPSGLFRMVGEER